ncbi:hypothetical protein DR864_08370 [Runella rosea]|uniref:Gingipain domain-containing protein n=1 Tax=Runella rosea TaxID=2259595 RepID=A0A344TGH8_9BACT|nr:C25 family cysteine peptidase [Runella rosea]AXE17749.1 hypothetical protein DR864_08370 [Runella rosea]
MRIFILAFFLGIGIQQSMGQELYTNDWIKYEQPYFKISLRKEGVYRISVDQLRKAGFPVASALVDQLFLFYRGEEVAVRVTGVTNGKLTESSYIEFFSQGNTGIQDSLVYRPYSARPPTTGSLYTDESAYFLTIVPNNKGKRMEEFGYQATAAAPEAFHLEREVKQYSDEWSFNNNNGLVPFLQQSYYEKGEGWTGKMIRRDSLAQVMIALTNRVTSSSYPIQLTALLNGRYESFHLIHVSVGQHTFATLDFFGFNHQSIKTTVAENELDARDTFTLRMKSDLNNQYEFYSLTKYEVVYPQRIEMNGHVSKYFYLVPNPANQSTVAIEGIPLSVTPIVYDVTQPMNPRALESKWTDGRWQTVVLGTAQARTLFVTTAAQSGESFKKVNFTPYPAGADYVIITHKGLESASQAYADYRKSAEGGARQVVVANIEQLYDQFNYGERGPLGIRNFLNYQLQTGKKDRYLLLVGNGVSFPDVLKTWQDRDFVPTFGYPGSDVLLSAGLGGANQNTPAFRTGRISASINEQVLSYLNKVKEFEKAPPTLNAKKILHLSGGKSTEEIQQLKGILGALEPFVEKSSLGGKVEVYTKRTNEPVENLSIADQVNKGLGMITFMGHASPTVPDVNIGYASDPATQLANKGRYPFMYFNGCGVGNVFYRYETLAADWLLTPQKGSIGVLSNSFWSYPSISAHYLKELYSAMFDQEATLGKPIGEILQKVSNTIATTKENEFDIANVHQLILLGDPAVVLFKINKPDYAVEPKGLFVQSQKLFSQSDSVQVGVIITNAGKVDEQIKSFSVRLTLTETNGTVSTKTFSAKAPTQKDTLLLSIKKNTGFNNIKVLLDAAQQIEELNKQNNEAQLTLNWTQLEQLTRYPANTANDRLNPVMEVTVDGKVIQNGALVSSTPVFSVLLFDDNPLELDTTLVQLYLKTCDSCAFKLLTNGVYELKTLQNLSVLFKPGVLAAGKYELLAQARDVNGNGAGIPYRIQFRIEEVQERLNIMVAPNPSSDYARFVYKLSGAAEGVLTIYSEEGKKVRELKFDAQLGENELYWIDPPASGAYLYRCRIGEKTATGKFIIH